MKKKVLVIEDNADNLLLITYVLERSGYTVVSETSGEEGVKAALREKPFLIIMDIQLPGIDGLETTRRIRASAVNTMPIIAMTSYAMRGDRDKTLAAGCTGYFEKPIDPLTIMDQIHEIIGEKAT
ncbi:MAG: response regulator [Desulfobulbaceae bacterium]|uniref:Response regulator n=1 Tax=Candidatus Desulfatifera sulfidica TaxID=2841691 RepID=A0A8J6TDG0_9BACT|nr:response regulator [Candidatus Desulfatifera sulfidica]